MKRLIVAVSGGVDSVVLLDKLVKQTEFELIVAHFDHGIRPDSAADARFVEGLSRKYGLPFETKREELGIKASEEKARISRHAFLREVAKKYGGTIATAHHQDDVIETIAINFYRGTGWRGLAVFGNRAISRPLFSMTKKDIRNYALTHRLEWVEDETNVSDTYLRNRLRFKINRYMPLATTTQLLELWHHQQQLGREIDNETAYLLSDISPLSRHFFTHIDEASGQELLRTLLERTGKSLLPAQRARVLHAIKTVKPGGTFEAGAGVKVHFSARTFIVETP